MLNVFRMLLPLLIVVACQPSIAQETETAKQSGSQAKTQKKSEIDPAKKADIKKMLVATGAGKMGMQVINQMIGMQRSQNPNVPKEFWDDFTNEVSADELIELTIPAYDKHLSHDDVKELLKFYESPIGKKLLKAQPMIVQDSMVAGQQWGLKLGRRIAERLQSEGYKP